MTELVHPKPLNRWANSFIQPGPVGSVGDVHVQPRLKHSAPDMPLRFEKDFAGENTNVAGSNVQDGQHTSFDTGGGGARLLTANWSMNRGFKTKYGYRWEDLRAPDKLVEPFVSSLGDLSWRNKIATTYLARRTGDQFLPLPGPYRPSPGEVPRGNVPIVTDMVDPIGDPLDAADSYMHSAVVSHHKNVDTNQANSRNRRNTGMSRSGRAMYSQSDEMRQSRFR